MEEFKREFSVIWADLDPNGHMRHTAYADYAVQLRFEFFGESELNVKTLAEMGIGPVLFREEIKYFREVNMNEKIVATLHLQKVRKDGSKWTFLHNIHKQSGELACQVIAEGAWMDLKKRKIIVPPAKLAEIIQNIPKADDFKWIPDKV